MAEGDDEKNDAGDLADYLTVDYGQKKEPVETDIDTDNIEAVDVESGEEAEVESTLAEGQEAILDSEENSSVDKDEAVSDFDIGLNDLVDDFEEDSSDIEGEELSSESEQEKVDDTVDYQIGATEESSDSEIESLDEVPASQDDVAKNEGVIDFNNNAYTQENTRRVNDEDIEKKVTYAVNEALADQRDAVIRAQADVQNMRRRCESDVEKAHKFALEKFSVELLSVMDNMERALQAVPDKSAAEVKGLCDGVELTMKGLLDVFEKFNIEQIDPEGEPFDPQLHQAMSMIENNEVEPNTVIAVMQKGYSLNGRVVRPAMVMVSKS